MGRRRFELGRNHIAKITSKSESDSSDIDWAKQNKMLRELRLKMRGQPVKTEWWSI